MVTISSAGMGGVSLLLIEAELPGVKTRRLATQGWLTSSTALVTFDDVKVPVCSGITGPSVPVSCRCTPKPITGIVSTLM